MLNADLVHDLLVLNVVLVHDLLGLNVYLVDDLLVLIWLVHDLVGYIDADVDTKDTAA